MDQRIPEARRIVLSEIEGTSLTPKFVNDALDCAGSAVIRDSVMLGIAERIAERLAQSESQAASLREEVERLTKELEGALLNRSDAPLIGSIQAAKEAVDYSRTPFAKDIARESSEPNCLEGCAGGNHDKYCPHF